MADSAPTPSVSDVPAMVFEKFLSDLATAKVSADVIKRLRTTLLEERSFTDRALKSAVLTDESLA